MLVQYRGKNLYSFADKFKLVPGLNEVDDSAINKAMNHPIFKQRVVNGSIIIVQAKRGNDGKMSLSDMRKFIPNIFDRKLLEKIMSEDERPDVHKLALAQLDKIKHPAAGIKKTVGDDQVEHFGGNLKGE